MHGTIIGHGTVDHNSRCYRIRVTKTKHTITRMKRQIKPSNIFAEDPLQNEIKKASHALAADRLNELVNHFTHRSKKVNNTTKWNRKWKSVPARSMSEAQHIQGSSTEINTQKQT